MKKAYLLATLMIVSFSVVLIQSCKNEKKDDPTPISTPQEFIADANTFKSFMSWPVQASKKGMDPFLGMAHAGNDSTVTRQVHFKDGQSPVNGKYPVGTIIVKHASNPSGSVNEFTGMVKRGNGFNPDAGDWEFFMLMPDGSIGKDTSGMDMRGANLMGGMCKSCHNSVASKDYIFSK